MLTVFTNGKLTELCRCCLSRTLPTLCQLDWLAARCICACAGTSSWHFSEISGGIWGKIWHAAMRPCGTVNSDRLLYHSLRPLVQTHSGRANHCLMTFVCIAASRPHTRTYRRHPACNARGERIGIQNLAMVITNCCWT
jgi:hypothetical protein